MTAAQINRLVVLATEMIEDADCKYQVTAGMHMPVLCERLNKAQGWHFEEGKS